MDNARWRTEVQNLPGHPRRDDKRMKAGALTGLAAWCAITITGCASGANPPQVPAPGQTSPPQIIVGAEQEPPPTQTMPQRPEGADYDREYAANWGFDRIGVAALHARGGTGAGVVIAITDVDASPGHRELSGKYDALDEHPQRWSGRGHGGPVAAIMAAKRDGRGMHGVAYEATLISIAGHATGTRKLRWLNEERPELLLVNSSVGGSLSPDPESFLAQARKFVDKGGVIVYATGNQRAKNPEATAAAPTQDGGLERGWLAVASIGRDGRFADHADRCGNAAKWCLVAPGVEIETIDGDTVDGYATRYGTSYAAPFVTSGIGALKSMFVSLSFQQLRKRVLHTANRTGEYNNESVYGQGLVDLDAASRPIGGLHLPIGANDAGPVHAASGAQVTVAARHATATRGTTTLMLDGYQRAPFTVELDTLVSQRKQLLAMADLILHASAPSKQHPNTGRVRWTRTGGNRRSQRTRLGPYTLTEEGAMAQATFATGNTTIEISGAMRFEASHPHPTGAGIGAWAPEHIVGARWMSHEARDSVEIAYAHNLARPGGLLGNGALKATGDAATVRYRRNTAVGSALAVTLEAGLAQLARTGKTSVIETEDATMVNAMASATLTLGRRTSARGAIAVEHPMGRPRTRLRIAESVDETGTLHYRSVEIDDGALSRLRTGQIAIVHQANTRATVGAAIAWAEDGGGTRDAIAGVQIAVRF